MNKSLPLEAKCDLCGKKGKAKEMMLCGGAFNYLCKPCRKLANEAINRYLKMLMEIPFRQVVGTFQTIEENGD